MYRLATMHRITDRWPESGRQCYHDNSRSYCIQYDQL